MLKRQDTSVAKAMKAYVDSLVRLFGQALLAVHAQPPAQGAPFLARLGAVCGLGKNVGYGVGDEMGELLDGHAVRS